MALNKTSYNVPVTTPPPEPGFFEIKSNLATGVVLPLFILLIGGCCSIYAVYKIRRSCRRKQRKFMKEKLHDFEISSNEIKTNIESATDVTEKVEVQSETKSKKSKADANADIDFIVEQESLEMNSGNTVQSDLLFGNTKKNEMRSKENIFLEAQNKYSRHNSEETLFHDINNVCPDGKHEDNLSNVIVVEAGNDITRSPSINRYAISTVPDFPSVENPLESSQRFQWDQDKKGDAPDSSQFSKIVDGSSDYRSNEFLDVDENSNSISQSSRTTNPKSRKSSLATNNDDISQDFKEKRNKSKKEKKKKSKKEHFSPIIHEVFSNENSQNKAKEDEFQNEINSETAVNQESMQEGKQILSGANSPASTRAKMENFDVPVSKKRKKKRSQKSMKGFSSTVEDGSPQLKVKSKRRGSDTTNFLDLNFTSEQEKDAPRVPEKNNFFRAPECKSPTTSDSIELRKWTDDDPSIFDDRRSSSIGDGDDRKSVARQNVEENRLRLLERYINPISRKELSPAEVASARMLARKLMVQGDTDHNKKRVYAT